MDLFDSKALVFQEFKVLLEKPVADPIVDTKTTAIGRRNNMWRIALFIILFMPALVLCENYVGNKYSATLFSIEIPAGMKIDESDVNQICLVFDNDPDQALGTISVSSKSHKSIIDKDEAWQKIRSMTLSGRTMLSEGEVQFADRKWKSISVMDETGSCKVKSNAFYAFSQTATFSFHYHCDPSNCEKITDAFNKITSSLRIN